MSFSADDNTQKEKAELLKDRDESPLTLTEERGAQPQRQQMGGASGGTDGTDAVLRDLEMDVGSTDGTPTASVQDGTDHAEHGDLNAVAEDSMDNEGGDGHQFVGGVEDEASQIATLHGQSHPSQQHATDDVGDGDGVGAGLPEPAAEGASETRILSITHSSSSRSQPDLSEHESTGAVMKPDGDAGNELGSQPEVLDWEYFLDKSIERQRQDSLGSTSADHHLSPDLDRADVIPKSDQEKGGNGDENRAEVIHGSDQEEGGNQGPTTALTSQQQTDQTKRVPLRLTAAEANWDDWKDVINEVAMLIDGVTVNKTDDPGSSKGDDPGSTEGDDQTPGVDSQRGGDRSESGQGMTESEPVKGAEKTRLVSQSDLGVGEHQSRIEPPNPADKKFPESGSIRPAESVEALKSPPMTNNNSGAAVDLGRGVEDDLNHKMQPSLVATSDPDEEDTLFRFPKPVVVPRAAGSGLPKNREFPDSGFGRTEGRDGTHADEDTSRRGESGQAGEEDIPPAQDDSDDSEDSDDWEDARKIEYVPGGSRHSSPSSGDAHDGGLSSESEYPNAPESAVKLFLGRKSWAGWRDLAKSEYMVLDGPGGESLVFNRASDAKDSPSAKSSRGRKSPSSEESDNGGGSPRLRRNRRQPPTSDDDKSPSSRPPNGASPRGAVHSAHSHPSYSPRKPDSHDPGYSPRKLEAGDEPPQLVTRRPLLYRDSRRDYTSEVEDMDVTSAPKEQIVHHHDHSLHEHEDALKYNVEKVLRSQTKYELICPICGAVITRKIVARKKKRRFRSEGDPRWRNDNEIAPVSDHDDGNQSPRSDTSSEFEGASAAWAQGVRPCFRFFFSSS